MMFHYLLELIKIEKFDENFLQKIFNFFCDFINKDVIPKFMI